MTNDTVFIDGLLADNFRGFPRPRGKYQEICAQPQIFSHYHPYHYLKDVTDATIGASGQSLETPIGAG
jgi:hypothetical protein